MIWGVQGDRGGIIAAASTMDRAEINVADDYERFGGSTLSSTGQPGRLLPIAGQTITWRPTVLIRVNRLVRMVKHR